MSQIDSEVTCTPEYEKLVRKQMKVYEKRFLKAERKHNKYESQLEQHIIDHYYKANAELLAIKQIQPVIAKITIKDRLLAEHLRDHSYALQYDTKLGINVYDNSPTDSDPEARHSPQKHVLKAKKSIRMYDAVIDEEKEEEAIVTTEETEKEANKAKADAFNPYLNVYFGLNQIAKVKRVTKHYTRILKSGKCQYVCSYDQCCKYSTRDYRTIVRHVHIKHMAFQNQRYFNKTFVNKTPWFTCIFNGCVYETGVFRDIVKHVSVEHNNRFELKNRFEMKCGFYGCEQQFSTDSQLQSHMREHLCDFKWSDDAN